ncbi:hypothetical protein [Streptomyces xanthophaeus]
MRPQDPSPEPGEPTSPELTLGAVAVLLGGAVSAMTGDVPASDEPETAVARLFEEVRNETWPTRLNSADRAGIDLVMLDASIAGCVTTWLGNGGVLDARRLGILCRRICDLEQVLPELGGKRTTPACGSCGTGSLSSSWMPSHAPRTETT